VVRETQTLAEDMKIQCGSWDTNHGGGEAGRDALFRGLNDMNGLNIKKLQCGS